MATGDGRTDYNVPPSLFVQVWQKASSVKEVSEALGMPISVCYVRAAEYKQKGVKLKNHKRVSGVLDVDELNKIIEATNAELAARGVEVPVVPERPASRNEGKVPKMSSEARGEAMAELLAKLRKKGKYVR
jgi:hypothetical protein